MDRLDKHFRTLTRTAFSRYGFAYADVLAQWSAIVGEDLGQVSAPERIRWPRGAAPAGDGEKRGGTLVLRVAEGRALEFQHLVPQIIDRINSFYGYQAVTAVKILQGTVAAPFARVQQLPEVQDETLVERTASIRDEALRAALLRLGSAVSHRHAAQSQSSSPTRTPS